MMATIVAGVDGSDGGQEALRFAVREARLRGARLRVVTAWHMPAGLEAALAALGEQADGVEIERAVRIGQPAQVLAGPARDAD